jgi:kumamolisin
MTTKAGYVSLPGSERRPLPQASVIGPTDPSERLEVTIRVRGRRLIPPPEEMATMAAQLPLERQYLTGEEYEQQYGAAPQDLERVAEFARSHGLQVVEQSAPRRSVILSGNVQAAEAAFGVTLEDYEYPQGTYRGRVGPVSIPAELGDIVEGVFGLDNRPFAKPHFSRRAAGASGATTFTPPALAQLYNFPAGADGTGQTIGIIELGGGYRPADLRSYFKRLGLSAPRVTSVSVDHARNHAVGSPDSADGEVVLDIEVAGAVAPGASLVVYFAPNRTDQNFLDALTAAIHDAKHKPSVISISWGGPESAASQAFMQQFDAALQSAALLGITVCAAAGDDGAADERADTWDGQPHVDFPSASPWILACGGTSLTASGSVIASEIVWNQHSADPQNHSFGATGGGISQFFPIPAYQQGIALPVPAGTGSKPGRGVPDVAGDADPATGYDVLVDGQFIQGFGGTSAVAPLWAGLIALISQSLGTRAGFVNTLLYSRAQAAGAFRDITQGDNKVGPNGVGYSATVGWDACTGLGTPNGQKILAALKGL